MRAESEAQASHSGAKQGEGLTPGRRTFSHRLCSVRSRESKFGAGGRGVLCLSMKPINIPVMREILQL